VCVCARVNHLSVGLYMRQASLSHTHAHTLTHTYVPHPTLQDLSIAEDVQPVLRKRFGMTPWFKRRGLPIEAIKQRSALAAQVWHWVCLNV